MTQRPHVKTVHNGALVKEGAAHNASIGKVPSFSAKTLKGLHYQLSQGH